MMMCFSYFTTSFMPKVGLTLWADGKLNSFVVYYMSVHETSYLKTLVWLWIFDMAVRRVEGFDLAHSMVQTMSYHIISLRELVGYWRVEWSPGKVGGAAAVGGAWRVCWTELNGCGVLKSGLTGLHLEHGSAHPHQWPVVPSGRQPRSLSDGSATADATRSKKWKGHQEEDGSDDDGRVV